MARLDRPFERQTSEECKRGPVFVLAGSKNDVANSAGEPRRQGREHVQRPEPVLLDGAQILVS